MPDKDPIIVEGQRLLGVVPGKPVDSLPLVGE